MMFVHALLFCSAFSIHDLMIIGLLPLPHQLQGPSPPFMACFLSSLDPYFGHPTGSYPRRNYGHILCVYLFFFFPFDDFGEEIDCLRV